MSGEIRLMPDRLPPFVRYLPRYGGFCLSYTPDTPGARRVTRPMTRWEVLMWRLFMKVPKP